MCGIVGIFLNPRDASSRVDRQLIETMCGRIVHRGPDDQGVFVDGPVGLGMRRLSILDLDGGSQPMYSRDGNVALVFNGEIYNYRELRADLEQLGHRFETDCDTEVLVRLYEQYGLDFVDHANGMFAVAVWDRRLQRLTLVRDRLGQKPLYYAETNSGLVFGSELKAVLASGEVPRRIDPEAVYHYFTLGVIPHPWTIYQGVRQLAPAERLVYQHGRVKREKYWRINSKVDTGLDEGEARERLRSLLTESVRLRMISDVPLGAFLSGGVDSSITVALMAQQSSQPVKTFFIDFDQPGYSERKYARSVAQRYGTEHHELVVRPSAVSILDRLVASFDEPFGDSSAIPTYCVSEMTRRHVTVALAGDGGDESFGGYARYKRILGRRQFPHWVRGGLGCMGGAIHRRLPRAAPGRRYFRCLGMDRRQFYAVGAAEFEARELLRPEFLETATAAESTWTMMRPYLESADQRDPLSPYSHCDLSRYLPDDILTKVDRMSMAHSLELRSPFLDYRVVELAARMPTHWKIRGGESKVLLKETFREDLPPEVLQPRKRGFSLPMADWLRGELREALNDALVDRAIENSGIFAMNEVRALAQEHLSGRRDRHAQMWNYLFFVHWWRHQASTVAEEPVAAPA